jgi:hypothetical protein
MAGGRDDEARRRIVDPLARHAGEDTAAMHELDGLGKGPGGAPLKPSEIAAAKRAAKDNAGGGDAGLRIPGGPQRPAAGRGGDVGLGLGGGGRPPAAPPPPLPGGAGHVGMRIGGGAKKPPLVPPPGPPAAPPPVGMRIGGAAAKPPLGPAPLRPPLPAFPPPAPPAGVDVGVRLGGRARPKLDPTHPKRGRGIGTGGELEGDGIRTGGDLEDDAGFALGGEAKKKKLGEEGGVQVEPSPAPAPAPKLEGDAEGDKEAREKVDQKPVSDPDEFYKMKGWERQQVELGSDPWLAMMRLFRVTSEDMVSHVENKRRQKEVIEASGGLLSPGKGMEVDIGKLARRDDGQRLKAEHKLTDDRIRKPEETHAKMVTEDQHKANREKAFQERYVNEGTQAKPGFEKPRQDTKDLPTPTPKPTPEKAYDDFKQGLLDIRLVALDDHLSDAERVESLEKGMARGLAYAESQVAAGDESFKPYQEFYQEGKAIVEEAQANGNKFSPDLGGRLQALADKHGISLVEPKPSAPTPKPKPKGEELYPDVDLPDPDFDLDFGM